MSKVKSTSVEISFSRSYQQFKIYFDGHIHLYIKLSGLIGIQSWLEGHNEYYIEYSYKDGTEILTAYYDKSIWIKILDYIDGNVHF